MAFDSLRFEEYAVLSLLATAALISGVRLLEVVDHLDLGPATTLVC
jgi:hypothetical protein